ncbi:MAG: SH3 domain-containing protein [Treponema sp.]|nr:SH3 domain-containing protein [Treponema sp.]
MKKILLIIAVLFMGFGSCGKKTGEENVNAQSEDLNETITENSIETQPEYWLTENVNLREEPGTNARVIKTLERGSMVQVLDSGREVTINGINARWIFVETEGGEKGWCFGGYLAVNKEISLLAGIWADGVDGNGLFYYLFGSNDKFLAGKFKTDERRGGNWFIKESNIHIDGRFEHNDKAYTEIIPFKIISRNKIQLSEKIYTRIGERIISKHKTSLDTLEKIMASY